MTSVPIYFFSISAGPDAPGYLGTPFYPIWEIFGYSFGSCVYIPKQNNIWKQLIHLCDLYVDKIDTRYLWFLTRKTSGFYIIWLDTTNRTGCNTFDNSVRVRRQASDQLQ